MAYAARWIRLQVPYGAGSGQMGAVMAYRGVAGAEDDSAEGKSLGQLMNEIGALTAQLGPALDDLALDLGALAALHLLEVDGFATIGETLDALLARADDEAIEIGESVLLILPLDARLDLAWAVKEEADGRGWEFSRDTPGDALPAEGIEPTREPTRDPDTAAEHMNILCEQAMEAADGMELGVAMTSLREALGVGVAHFGWSHQYTGHVLRYLAQVLTVTGNEGNRNEALLFLRRMCHSLEGQADLVADENLVACLGMLAEDAAELDDDISQRLAALAAGEP